jgi:hypothetical protein
MWLRYLSTNAYELRKAGTLPLIIVHDEQRRDLWHREMRKIRQVEQAHDHLISPSRHVGMLIGMLPELLQAPSIWHHSWQWLGWHHVGLCCQLCDVLTLWLSLIDVGEGSSPGG